MPATYALHDEPSLESPLLVMCLEGWIDAGFAAANAMATLLGGLRTYPVATFDADELLDHRARRPVMHLVDGVNTSLSWPGIELRGATDLDGRDVLLLVGAEPDHFWRSFARAVVDLAERFGVRMIVGLGAYPAAVPHTRPTRLSVTANSDELAGRWGLLRGSLDVPAGAQAVIEQSAADVGMGAVGLWAQVPHYVSAMSYPAASIALIEQLATVGGLSLPSGDLADEARIARARFDDAIAGNEEHQHMVTTLEAEADDDTGEGGLPSGDELAAEVERFLRDQGSGS